MARQKFVFASANPGKLREIREILAALDCEIVAQCELDIASVAESGSTFVDNAIIKARHAADQSGLAAISDDSGLLVDALEGRPGVNSARYAGEGASDDDNIDMLLAELEGLPPEERDAHYECAAVWVSPDASVTPLVAQGRWRGRILSSRRGEGGFGYDPVFLDLQLHKSGAEMSVEEKNRQSHRGKAFRRLGELLLR
ncbi:MAG: RdgB/HAM1 family non-canonical purine NTP pyrophosphatase [Woeseiaceae bacterium]